MEKLSPEVLTWVRRIAFLLGIGAIALSIFGRRLGLLEFRPGGSSFDTLIRPVFLAVFVLGLLLALRWELVGGLIATFAAAGLVAFAFNQLITTHALLVVVAFALPGILWLLLDIQKMSQRGALASVAATLVLVSVGFLLGDYAYQRVWGPQHPPSDRAALPDSALDWVWSGSTTSESIEVKAKTTEPFEDATLVVSTSPDLANPRRVAAEPPARAEDETIIGFTVSALSPATEYFYAVELDGTRDEVRQGRFRTFPNEPASFTVAIGACARVGSNGSVFDAIHRVDPLLYLILGDFHYGDTGIDDIGDYRDVMDITLSEPAQANLYRNTPIAYVWDDHDYGVNDSDGESVSRPAAMASYRSFVPSYELAGPQSAIYQAFSIGRVRFVMTDTRSARTPQSVPDGPSKSMLGVEQKAWLKQELKQAAATHQLVVWVNPVPWIAETKEGADNWAGYATERKELAQFIADNDIKNLLMLSGDAHMVAIDDGTNTNYSDAPGPAFPLVHSAALDRPGGVKGGPYSEGAMGGSGQFVTMDVTDTPGQPMQVLLTALNWKGEVLMDYSFEVPSPT